MPTQPHRNRNVRCTGRSVIRDDHNMPILDADGARQFKPCLNWAANDTDLCGVHGGALQPTIAAAQRKLRYGAETLVDALWTIARDERETSSDRIKAINSYLDRAGIRAGVEVSLEVPVWQQRLRKMFGPPEDTGTPVSSLAPTDEAEETKPRKRAPRKAAPLPANVVPLQRKAAPRKATRPAPRDKPWD